ncbi:MAG TPA: prephenate dehydratase domain-containing protein [Pyrinomonadaceae bacterium]|nr:prephenate dehydratase domain-containing protein [Pyrinomonadaceae bacterium]
MPQKLIVGIQGGKGSFNELALRVYLERKSNPEADIEIKYLYTTERVLSELKSGVIARGQFATMNSIGGPVEETGLAQQKYSFDENYEVIDQYSIQVVHCLMVHPEARLDEVDTIMTHPQVLAQCRDTIARRYPRMILTEGQGDLIDPAKVGEAIARGSLPRNVATISNRLIADAWGLMIVDHDLQDRADNFTQFVFVKLRG